MTNPARTDADAARQAKDPRVRALFSYFGKHGWPIASRDVERETEGRVSSDFISRYVSGPGRDHVSALGAGLYVPSDKLTETGVPVCYKLAQEVLALSPDDMIDDHTHLRLYKLAMILARRGFATIRLSRTKRSGVRRQTARLTLTETGREMLEGKAPRLVKDEF